MARPGFERLPPATERDQAAAARRLLASLPSSGHQGFNRDFLRQGGMQIAFLSCDGADPADLDRLFAALRAAGVTTLLGTAVAPGAAPTAVWHFPADVALYDAFTADHREPALAWSPDGAVSMLTDGEDIRTIAAPPALLAAALDGRARTLREALAREVGPGAAVAYAEMLDHYAGLVFDPSP
ncbi:hypothetical protein [Falsiroseomonas stagni]|nr:hypothetical protein [Falsiroseomonas stagni]